MRVAGAEVSFGNHRDRGKRDSQQDYFAIHTEDGPPATALLVLADGVGGQAGGEIASVEAVHAFVRQFAARSDGAEPSQSLAECVRAANRAVVNARVAHASQMASTVVAAWVAGDGFRWASVGDSIVLLCRAGTATRLNRDHNVGAGLAADIAAGAVDAAAVGDRSRRRAHLTSYLGMETLSEVDISDEQPLSPGDTIVLCSDGVTDALSLREIASIVETAADAAEACEALVGRAIGKGRPRQDNTSAVAVRLAPPPPVRAVRPNGGASVPDAQDSPTVLASRRRLPSRRALAIIGAALLLLAVAGIVWVTLPDSSGGTAAAGEGGPEPPLPETPTKPKGPPPTLEVAPAAPDIRPVTPTGPDAVRHDGRTRTPPPAAREDERTHATDRTSRTTRSRRPAQRHRPAPPSPTAPPPRDVVSPGAEGAAAPPLADAGSARAGQRAPADAAGNGAGAAPTTPDAGESTEKTGLNAGPPTSPAGGPDVRRGEPQGTQGVQR